MSEDARPITTEPPADPAAALPDDPVILRLMILELLDMSLEERLKGARQKRRRDDLLLKIGIHEGPCLAVNLNERQDYFGQTVNIASRVQGLAATRSILTTASVVNHPEAAAILKAGGLNPTAQQRAVRGIAGEVAIYEIP